MLIKRAMTNVKLLYVSIYPCLYLYIVALHYPLPFILIVMAFLLVLVMQDDVAFIRPTTFLKTYLGKQNSKKPILTCIQ